MERQLRNLSFEEWLLYVFDHPVEEMKNAWYWDMDREWWDEAENPAETVQFLTQTFENAGVLLEPYSDAQLTEIQKARQALPKDSILHQVLIDYENERDDLRFCR